MLKHIFIMLWNQKKKYTALVFEQVLVFIAVILSLTIAFDTVKSARTPGMLETDNVMCFGYVIGGGFNGKEFRHSVQAMDAVKDKLEKKPYVTGICESYNFIPYTRPTEYYWEDSVSFVSGKKLYAHLKCTDEAAEKVFRPDIIQGRWFRDGERVNGLYPVVITKQLAEASEISDPVGKTIYMGSHAFTIIGVISGIKEEVLVDAPPSIIIPIKVMLPTGSTGLSEELAARIKPGYEDEFANDFYHEFNLQWDEDDKTELYFRSCSDDKKSTMEKAVIGVAVTALPALFFLLFTLIGTIGVNLMDLQERKHEFALRISCGSTKRKAISLLLWQNIILTGISTIPGIAIALCIYPLATALPVAGFALALALVLSLLCALYPTFIILKMKPAELLKEE